MWTSYANISVDNLTEAESVINTQVSQIKLLAYELESKNQEISALKETNRKLSDQTQIYKKEILNLEAKLSLYDQEVHLKVQSAHEKNKIITSNNNLLQKQAQDLQNIILDYQDKYYKATQTIDYLQNEIQNLQNTSQTIESNLHREYENCLSKDTEINTMTETLRILSDENHEMREKVKTLQGENQEFTKIIANNEINVHKAEELLKEHDEIKTKFEQLMNVHNQTNWNYEQLKIKHEQVLEQNVELAENHSIVSMENQTLRKAKLDLETAINELQLLIDEQTSNITMMATRNLDIENTLQQNNAFFENEIRKAINVMDGHSTRFPADMRTEYPPLRALHEKISQQNKEIIKLNEKIDSFKKEGQDDRLSGLLWKQERDELKNTVAELTAKNVELNNRLTENIQESLKTLQTSQAKFDEKLQMITNFSNETESRLKGTLHEKDDEISILKQEVEMANEKIQWAEEERQKTLEFLREQEAEIKKFKEKFYDIAQKASLQTQSQLEYTQVLVLVFNVFWNLLKKYAMLSIQKHFLQEYYYQYENLKSLITISNPNTALKSARKKYKIYAKFRKSGYAVLAIIRMKNMTVPLGNQPFDSKLIQKSLGFMPDGIKKLLSSLFRSEQFKAPESSYNDFVEVMNELTESEQTMACKLFAVACENGGFLFDPEERKYRIRVKFSEDLLDIMDNLIPKIEYQATVAALENNLRSAESHIFATDVRHREEIESISATLKDFTRENDELAQEKEKISQELQETIIKVEKLASFLKLEEEKNALLTQEKDLMNQNLLKLHEEIRILSKANDKTSKDLQIAEMRIDLLERNREMPIGRATFGGSTNTDRTFMDTPMKNSIDRAKVVGKIIKSGSEKKGDLEQRKA